MKKLLLLIVLLPVFMTAQSPKDNLLGHYIGIERVTDMSSGTYSDCPGTIYNIKAAPNYPKVIVEDTSCWVAGNLSWNFEVFNDSTIKDSIDPTFVNRGRLFSNDSLYLIWYSWGNPTQYEFFGFKQSSFPAPTGLNEFNSLSDQISLMPQPASDFVYIQSKENTFNGKEAPKLHDINGRFVKVDADYLSTGEYKLDLSTITSGVYLMGIKVGDTVVRKKIIVN